MMKLLMVLVALAIASVPAVAGPNANGCIVVHNTGIPWSTALEQPPVSPVPTVDGIDNMIPWGSGGNVSEYRVWKVYAVFPPTNNPRLRACAWGISYPSLGGGSVVILGQGAPSPTVFSVQSAAWPGHHTFNGMEFADGVRTGLVTELWWFGGYAYGSPQTFCIIPSDVPANRVFLDDTGQEDEILNYGCLGFGQAGYTPCKTSPGACCFSPCDCQVMTETQCIAAGGSFDGSSSCSPNPCGGTCPGGALSEGELPPPAPDILNGGCSITPHRVQALTSTPGVSAVMCGTSYAVDNLNRDNDWYCSSGTGAAVTATCTAAFPAEFGFVVGGVTDCSLLEGDWQSADPCVPMTATAYVDYGNAVWFCVRGRDGAVYPLRNYVLKVSGIGDSSPCSAVGACCALDGTCVVMSQTDCADSKGTYLGDFTFCRANPCSPVPTERRSWGALKNLYR